MSDNESPVNIHLCGGCKAQTNALAVPATKLCITCSELKGTKINLCEKCWNTHLAYPNSDHEGDDCNNPTGRMVKQRCKQHPDMFCLLVDLHEDFKDHPVMICQLDAEFDPVHKKHKDEGKVMPIDDCHRLIEQQLKDLMQTCAAPDLQLREWCTRELKLKDEVAQNARAARQKACGFFDEAMQAMVERREQVIATIALTENSFYDVLTEREQKKEAVAKSLHTAKSHIQSVSVMRDVEKKLGGLKAVQSEVLSAVSKAKAEIDGAQPLNTNIEVTAASQRVILGELGIHVLVRSKAPAAGAGTPQPQPQPQPAVVFPALPELPSTAKQQQQQQQQQQPSPQQQQQQQQQQQAQPAQPEAKGDEKSAAAAPSRAQGAAGAGELSLSDVQFVMQRADVPQAIAINALLTANGDARLAVLNLGISG